MRRYLILLLYLSFLSCNFHSQSDKRVIKSKEIDYQGSILLNKEQEAEITKEDDYKKLNPQVIETFAPIDTVSLSAFWLSFQDNLRNGNKQEVIEVLEYPIHAIFPVLFRYAHDCDTLAYIKGNEKYWDFDIDINNVREYFDFVFTDILKEVIYQTSFNDLLSKGIRYKNKSGMTYEFFPKDYNNVQVNCSNDHLMMFYISYKNDKWKIGIGGL